MYFMIDLVARNECQLQASNNRSQVRRLSARAFLRKNRKQLVDPYLHLRSHQTPQTQQHHR